MHVIGDAGTQYRPPQLQGQFIDPLLLKSDPRCRPSPGLRHFPGNYLCLTHLSVPSLAHFARSLK